jgi:hypothetical protein
MGYCASIVSELHKKISEMWWFSALYLKKDIITNMEAHLLVCFLAIVCENVTVE